MQKLSAKQQSKRTIVGSSAFGSKKFSTTMISRGSFLAIVCIAVLVRHTNGMTVEVEWNNNEILQQSQKVLVSLYYESLCGGCRDFSKTQLCPLYKSMGDYINVEFVPYGNARSMVSNSTGDITILCQHGENECEGNRIQSCALKHLTYDQSTRLICCVESSSKTAKQCAQQLGIKYAPLQKCADSAEGMKLLYLNGVKTDQLVPPHEYVPWVLINGKFTPGALEHLLVDVCEKIPDPKPSQCNEVDY
jgi:interferon gamma-inducible protein 30